MINTKSKILFFSLIFYGTTVSAQADTSQFLYKKPLFDFDYGKPVFKFQKEQLLNKNRLMRYFILTGYREGVKPISGQFGLNYIYQVIRDQGLQRYSMYNLSITDMVTRGIVKGGKFEIVLEVKNPSKYDYVADYGNKLIWMRKNSYCFETIYPIGIDINKLVDDQLCDLFGIKFGFETRLRKVLILCRTSGLDKIKSKGKGEEMYDMNGYFNNVVIDRISEPMRAAGLPPIVDETGYKDPIDLNMNIKSWKDISAVRRELQKYDLDLIEGNREITVFVIREKK